MKQKPMTKQIGNLKVVILNNKQEVANVSAFIFGLAIIQNPSIVLGLATGKHKTIAVNNAIKGLSNTNIPASLLQCHPNCVFILDKEAAGDL